MKFLKNSPFLKSGFFLYHKILLFLLDAGTPSRLRRFFIIYLSEYFRKGVGFFILLIE